jgi:dihydroorotase-like cyclic amidohydrolase
MLGQVHPADPEKSTRSGSGRRFGTGASQRSAQITLATKQNGGKQFGDIWISRPGLPSGMEHLLPLLLSSGVSAGRLDMQTLVRIGSENTAKVFGLYPRKGALQPGSDADLA